MNISAASYIEKETRRESRQQQEQARRHNNNTRRNEGNNNNGNRRPARDGRSNTRQDGKLFVKMYNCYLNIYNYYRCIFFNQVSFIQKMSAT